jgi:hypothetical protein
MTIYADFTALPLVGTYPLNVQFTDASTADGGSVITDRLWTFDDGDTSTDVNPSHQYTVEEQYSPSLKVIQNVLEFQIPTAPALSWDVLIYANGLFVALANNEGMANVIMTSPDGINWTQRTTPAIPPVGFITLIYDGSEFIAFGNNNTDQSLYSVDGITWIQRTISDTLSTKNVAYGAGAYVLIKGATYYSSDAINWVYLSPTAFWNRENVDYVNGNFVTTGQVSGGAASTFIGVSTNGSSWATRTIPLSSLGRVAYGNGVYVLTRGRNPGSDQVMVSSDLITWNIHSVGLGGTLWNDITFDNGLFVMTSNNLSGTKVASSPDGINWTGITITGDAVGKVWRGITGNGSGLYVMVNQNGDAAYSTIVELETDTELKIDYITVNNPTLSSLDVGSTVDVSVDAVDVVSEVFTSAIEALPSVIADSNFLSSSKWEQVIVIYEHNSGQNRKIVHKLRGADWIGYENFPVICNGGTWLKNKVILVDDSNDMLVIDRDEIGTDEDIIIDNGSDSSESSSLDSSESLSSVSSISSESSESSMSSLSSDSSWSYEPPPP